MDGAQPAGCLPQVGRDGLKFGSSCRGNTRSELSTLLSACAVKYYQSGFPEQSFGFLVVFYYPVDLEACCSALVE